MGVRGFVWATYVSDDGNTYVLRVDADYAVMPERGWIWPAAPGWPVYPRGWKPRRVVGLDAAGNKHEALVASVSADLWTGAAATFTINGTDGAAHTCTVLKRLRERFGSRPH